MAAHAVPLSLYAESSLNGALSTEPASGFLLAAGLAGLATLIARQHVSISRRNELASNKI